MSSNANMYTQDYYAELFANGCGWYFRLVNWYFNILHDYFMDLNFLMFILLALPPVMFIMTVGLGVVTLIIAIALSLYVIFSWPFVLAYYKRY